MASEAYCGGLQHHLLRTHGSLQQHLAEHSRSTLLQSSTGQAKSDPNRSGDRITGTSILFCSTNRNYLGLSQAAHNG